MAFDDIRDQLSERAQSFWSRVQESSIYIRVAEKYGDLNATSQRLVLVVGTALLILFTLMIPWSYISSSQKSISDFEENKALLRDLFRVTRASAELEGAPPQIDPNMLVTSARAKLSTMNLQAEQIANVTTVDNNQGPAQLPGVPKAVQQKGIEVTLKKLNLRQIIEIGYQLMTLQPGLKMTGITMNASSPNPHYFDAVYRIISFSLPTPAESIKPVPGKKGAKAPAKKKSTSDDAGEE